MPEALAQPADQEEAIGLYKGPGLRRSPPFGAYKPDPLSVCYEKQIG